MSTDDAPDLAGSNQRLAEIVARLHVRVSELEAENASLAALHELGTLGGSCAMIERPEPLRPMLYVAGPYTAVDPVANTRAALIVGDIVYRETNWLPIVPHVSLLGHLVTPHGPAHWYDFDLRLLEHCAAITRLPGESPGADREMSHAVEHALRYVSFLTLPAEAQAAWHARYPD